MPQAAPPAETGRVVRPRLRWRLLLTLVLLLGGFLYLTLMALGGYLLMLGLDAASPQPQRLMALGAGAGVMLVCLWLLKVAMPRRLSPALVEPGNT
ncbi:hypothetical protein F3J44_11510 [Pantoea sp. Tr-811]|uniref:hypothetical protein n=1 Tax=Pantoea sp. Tr-811 TaxID=2608361 RepID=UPI001420E891|nr:hypothetical protein [Pantoea sp. Tr-811]NIF26999.1 hypothetical protein [Pantoea sp. Tr-811]